MKKILLLILLATSLAVGAQRTTRKALKADPSRSISVSTESYTDTIVSPAAHTVDLNGYDKPLRSHNETFFATNNSKADITGIAFTITYLDTSHREMHKAHHNVRTDIPAGETRQIAVRSWDKQQSFYYVRSTAPTRTQQATPYDVKIQIDTLFVSR